MKITHLYTSKTRQGWISVLKIETDAENFGLVIAPDNPVRPVVKDSVDAIQQAMSKQTITEQSPFMRADISNRIAEPLCNWLGQSHDVHYLDIRWDGEIMRGFASVSAAREHDTLARKTASPEPKRPSKSFMMG